MRLVSAVPVLFTMGLIAGIATSNIHKYVGHRPVKITSSDERVSGRLRLEGQRVSRVEQLNWTDLQHAPHDDFPKFVNTTLFEEHHRIDVDAAMMPPKPLSRRIVKGFPGPSLLPYVTSVYELFSFLL